MFRINTINTVGKLINFIFQKTKIWLVNTTSLQQTKTFAWSVLYMGKFGSNFHVIIRIIIVCSEHSGPYPSFVPGGPLFDSCMILNIFPCLICISYPLTN
ncbi:hypothetical protein PPACK8108_LOCUS3775 [Phakopsora pachyrhizi]|uniref:Uncharacterized protein n=1 Tax=Phakopsora pachyrhizi TaxID=170000 RepID=A0AAV0ANR7_PHAPC|nr:hypothetical protein PPACK8108_LOCUS3775 [Phakopsora pachyrhizi]